MALKEVAAELKITTAWRLVYPNSRLWTTASSAGY